MYCFAVSIGTRSITLFDDPLKTAISGYFKKSFNSLGISISLMNLNYVFFSDYK